MDKYDFGNRLYEYRTQKGLTQKELGKLLGVTDKAVSKWETGESKPRLDKMNQITELFETSIDGMLGKEPSADGEQLKPYKTIFDVRLKKYSKYYKTGRIWTYILTLICFVCSAFENIGGMLNGGLVTEKISSLVGMIILTSAAVILTSSFKPKFDECESKDLNIFIAFITALFLLLSVSHIISEVEKGKITGEYDTFNIGLICVEVLILAVIASVSSLKKRYNAFVIVTFFFSVINLSLFETGFYFAIFAIIFQFNCFVEKRNWLALAYKADLEIEKTAEIKKSTKIFVTVVSIITVLSVTLSPFSPYITYKIALMKYYPTYKQNEVINYDYSAKFDEEFTEVEFKGAKLKIPKDYESFGVSEYSVGYENAQNDIISINYSPREEKLLDLDESDIDNLEPADAARIREEYARDKYIDALSQKYFGVSYSTFYGTQYILNFVDLEDVRFYESQKAALLYGALFTKKYLDTGIPVCVSSFDNGMYCGFVDGRKMPLSDETNNSVYWTAHVWHSTDKDGAYYMISYLDRDGSGIKDNQMICKLVNSLEF